MQRKERIVIKNSSLFGLLGKELSFQLTLIPSGWYVRGAKNSDQEALDNEKPRHTVKISRPFWMMETQITEEVFLHVNPQLKYRSSQPTFPARKICWYDAVRFCNELSEICKLPNCYTFDDTSYDAEGFETTKVHWKFTKGFRLPTEAEWEWAAKSLSNSKYSGSTTLADVGYFDENTRSEVVEVGQLLPNNWGLYDMSGNVFEWCWDWFGEYPQDKENENKENENMIIDPRGPDIGTERVVRGGSWNSEESQCRVTGRHHVYPTSELDYVGFRCVLEANGKPVS